jgi:hypothetical protein
LQGRLTGDGPFLTIFKKLSIFRLQILLMLIRIMALTSLLLLFMTTITKGQMAFGVKAGPDFPKMLDAWQGVTGNGNNVTYDSKATTNLYGGVFLDVPLGRLFSFRPGLGYLGAGGSLPQLLDFNGNQLAPATKYNLDYFNLPLQLLFRPSLPFGRPFIGGGFYGGMLVAAKAITPVSVNTRSLSIGNSPVDNVKRWDFGFNATAGINLNCGILIGVDFQQGLTSISPSSASGSATLDTRNSVWGVSIGYLWILKNQRPSGHSPSAL